MSVKVERSESLENTCPVCHDQIEVYAIGPCDHPVCYRCSTRMRVLCEQMDCPICRGQMPQVAFVHKKSLFKDLNLRNCIPNRKYKIFFADEDVEDRYLDLLEFRCRICKNRQADRTFQQLQTHMRRDHQLFACDLCVSHIKIFPFERKFYNRKNLATHRRVGDADDKSYKGHPLCEFCDARYNDKDELLKHLRKDHYYCHFCDQHGSNAYYDQYPDLKKHFSESHFLCTEGECANPETQWTHAFATEIDLKAHKASVHSKSLSKAQSREARTIELDFQLPRRQGNRYGGPENGEDSRSAQGGRGRGNDRYNRRRDYNQEDFDMQRAIEASKETARATEATPAVEERVPDPINDFPTLKGAIIPASVAVTQNAYSKPKQSPEEEFPTLSSSSSSATKGSKQQKSGPSKPYSSVMNFQAEVKPAAPVQKESKPVSLGSVTKVSRERWSVPAPKNTDEEYPALGGKTSAPNTAVSNDSSGGWLVKSRNNDSVNSKISIVHGTSNHRPKTSQPLLRKTITDENEFPALGGGQSRSNSVLGNSLTDWAKQNKSNGKKASASKPEKFDDSFELPDSYYKSYDDIQSKGEKQSLTQTAASKSEAVEAVPKPAQLNSANEFPGLPAREKKQAVAAPAEKKKKKKPKKEENKSNNQPKSKTDDDSNASLNDIALMLMQGGEKNGSENEKEVRKNASTSGSVKAPKPTDWFDNPLADLEESPRPAAKKEVKENPKKKDSEPVLQSVDSSDSFPSLHAMSISIQQPKPPPGFVSEPSPAPPTSATSVTSPPPGFAKRGASQSQSSTPAPPPGFSPNAVFIEPADFKKRNLQLIQDIREALGTIEDGFSNFKILSGQFRQGLIEASDYYVSCQALMGDEDFAMVFPELLVLLPDVKKQRELWEVHQAMVGKKSSTAQTSQKVSQCKMCGQVMLKPDVQHHQFQHESLSDFPALGGSTDKTAASASSGAGPDISLKGTWIKAK